MSAPDAKAPKPRKSRRRLRWIVLVLLLLIVALGVTFAVISRGPMARRMVLDRLSSMIVGDVDVGSAKLGLNGQMLLRDIRVRARGIDGEPGLVVHADAARLELDGLLSGSPSIRSVVIDRPLIRVSQDTQTGDLNLTRLQFRSDGSSGGALPDIQVTDGLIELGEHNAAGYHVLRRLPVSGKLEPGDRPQSYQFSVVQGQPGGPSAELKGTITDDEIEVRVSELELSDWPNDAVPTRYRALHRALDLKGAVQPRHVRVPRQGPIELEVGLEDVELNLPLDEAPVPRGHMTNVDGVLQIGAEGVRATLTGLLDGVPAQAQFSAPVLDMSSSFVAHVKVDRIRLNDNLHRLNYVPEYVREKLAMFSNPTAELELDLTLQRPHGSSQVQASGEFKLFDGVASFRDFPYEFHNMSAVFTLEGERLEFHDITGVAETGARLKASGWVEPLSDDAAAEIFVHVDDVPLDDNLRQGFRPRDRSLFDSLQDRAALARLRQLGLIASPQQHAAWSQRRDRLRTMVDRGEADEAAATELIELENRLAAPVFELGGVGNVDVHVKRYLGHEGIWDTEIRVNLPQVGLVSEHFPLPIIAENVRLRVFNHDAELLDGAFRGLEGGTAHIEASAVLDDAGATPHVSIEARELPVTPLLIQAIPGPREGAGDSASDVRVLLEQLGLKGTVHCTANVGTPDAPEFVIVATPESMQARPRPWTAADGATYDELELRDIEGSITVRPEQLDIALAAQLESQGQPSGRAALDALIGFGETQPEGIDIRRLSIDLADLKVQTPVEQLLSVFSLEAAEELSQLRQARQPAGILDALVTHASSPDAAGLTTLSLKGLRDFSVAFQGGRLGLASAEGDMVVERGDRLGVTFRRFGGPATFDAAPLGDLHVDGAVTVADRVATGQLTIDLDGGRLESQLLRSLAEAKAPSLAATLEQINPAGTYSLHGTLDLTGQGDVRIVEAQIHPHTLAFTRGSQRLIFQQIEGLVAYADDAGRIESLSLQSDELSATLNGVFSLAADNAFDMELGFDLHAPSLNPAARAILPEALDRVLRSLNITTDGPINLEQGHLLVAHRAEGDQIDALGLLRVQQGKASIGVELEQLDAELRFAVHMHPSLRTPDFQIELTGAAMQAAGVWLSDARCSIRSSGDGSAIEIGPFSADAHDGRVSGSALVWTEPGDERARYELRFLTSGVRLSPVLADLALETQPPDPEEAADSTRGAVDAQFTLFGQVDGPRRGIGTAQVSGGRVLRLPLLVPIIEVSNLQPPLAEKLDIASTQFYLRDQTVTFESLSVLSRSIELVGYGTMTLPDLSLDLRINTRSQNRLGVLGSVLEGVRDELLTTRVAGTLRDPKMSMEQFAGTRRAISSLFGHEPDDRERLIQEIKRQAMRHRDRMRLSSTSVQRAVHSVQDRNTQIEEGNDEQP